VRNSGVWMRSVATMSGRAAKLAFDVRRDPCHLSMLNSEELPINLLDEIACVADAMMEGEVSR
jgi:hypothetical protein